MRTTLDLPDDILRRAKIAAVERGSTLRQLVVDALRHELEGGPAREPRRLTAPPVRLSPDSPLRRLHPDEIKRLDAQAVEDEEVARAHAMHR